MNDSERERVMELCHRNPHVRAAMQIANQNGMGEVAGLVMAIEALVSANDNLIKSACSDYWSRSTPMILESK